MIDKGSLRQINISLQDSEYQKFVAAYEKSTYRSKSSYARKLLLGKPVELIYRNRSLDDFIETAVKLRQDLKALLAKETFTPSEKQELKQKMGFIEESLIKIVDICKQK